VGAQSPAGSEEKQRCASAYLDAQRLRRSAELVAAKEKLLVCARATCPAAARNDCSLWLDEVSRALPSVVLVARSRGEDLSAAEAYVDGRRVPALDGKALELDPGPHEVRFAHGGRERRRQIVLHEGEKLRSVVVDFDPPPGPAGGPASGTTTATATATARPVPLGAYVLGGVGLVALGGAGFFWLRGKSIEGDLVDSGCDKPRTCSPDRVENAERTNLVGDVLLGAGVAALAGATVWYVLRPSVERPVVGLHLGPAPGGQGAKGGLWVRF
jgi:hypothetical protein